MAKLTADSVERIVAFVRDGNSTNVNLADAMALSQLMADSFDSVFRDFDTKLHQEFSEIANAISNMHSEIGRLQANDMTAVRIPTAGRELEAIVDATELATDKIMESAEAIMDVESDEATKSAIDAHCMTIFEACSFQDITGQRVSKVIETLKHIEERVTHFASNTGVADLSGPMSDEERQSNARRDEQILNGPALVGDGVNQKDIDDMLHDASEDDAQDDIDRMFA